jgi:N-acetylneuraminate lyase
MKPVAGIITALLTPFDDNGAIDRDAFGLLVDFQAAQGVHGLYVGGTTGEAVLQSLEERELCLRLAAEANEGRLGLIAHVGAIATADVLRLSERAAALGYAAIAAIPPFYYPFSPVEVATHYREVARQSALPLIVYNFPALTKGFTTAELLALLAEPGIVGVKHTSSDLFSLERVLRHRPDTIIYSGYDEMCVGGLAMGAQGAIGTTYNFMGDVFVALRRHVLAGELPAAMALQRMANDVIEAIIAHGVIPSSKAIMEIMGVRLGSARQPFRRLEAAERAALESAVQPILAWRSGRRAGLAAAAAA